MNVPEKIHPENSPDNSTRALGGGISNRNENVMHDRAGFYVAIIALMVSCLALGGVFMYLGMQDKIIAAQIAAGSARAEAVAAEAKTHARVALDKVEDFRAKLAEKNIRINLDGH